MSLPDPPLLSAAPAAPLAADAGHGWPVLRLGFRPFYLGAAALAALAVPLWLAMLLGAPLPVVPVLPALYWHAHEMLFGFAAAVIVGFLLTAGKAWTGLATPRGWPLGALVALWLAARVTGLTGPPWLHAGLDVLLLPLVATLLLGVLLRAGNRRNLPLPAMLMALAAANAAFHAATLGWLALSPMVALHAGLALIVMIECVMAGRVVPAFTQSATPGLKLAPARHEAATLGLTAAGLAAWVLWPGDMLGAPLLAAAAVLHVLRLRRWQPQRTRSRPILWILHASYAWIPIGLALLAAAQAGLLGASPGVHALAVGATGGLIIGMVTRTARGHTGRPLTASPLEVAAYALVMAAALLRALVPVFTASTLPLLAAGAAWSAAFALYLWLFTPWLLRPRLDGKDG